MKIQVILFGVPKIIVDHETIEFPFRKAEAIFYYLCVRRRVTRDELVNLFWSELKEETAKKNLRNALYQIKKTLGDTVLKTPKRTIVELGESVEIDCDVDQLLENKEIDAYIGPFLQGYTVKNAINFDDWMIGFREHCRERFTEYAYETVETDTQDFNHLIQTMQVVIKVDPYDERAYRLIMDAYARSGHVNKSFKIFQSLKNILNEDLGVEPDLETKSLFEKLAVQREEESTPRQPANMYGRKQELEILNRGLRNYTADISYKSILIEGEAGIGKTTLLENFLESQVLGGDSESLKRPIVLSTICYQSEAAFYLKPWHAILEQIIDLTNAHDIFWPVQWRRELLRIFPSLADRLVIDEMDIEQSISLSPTLQVHLLEDIISQLLGLITSKFKILITVDDLQWMDEMSLAILTSQMLQYGRDKLMFIGLKRSGSSNVVRKMKATLLRNGLVDVIHLSRFTRSDIKAFLKQTDSNIGDDDILDAIYSETEGNPFFIKEYLIALSDSEVCTMTTAMRNIIEGRFNDLTKDASNLLDLIACFSDKIEFEALREVSGKNELELLEFIDELQGKNILLEGGESGQLSFSHHKIREYIYENLNATKRKVLNLKIAEWFLQHIRSYGYERVIYHYRQAEEFVKAMKYHLIYIEGFLNFEHELYPVIDVSIDNKTLRLADNNRVMLWFKEAESELEVLREQVRSQTEIDYLKMRLLLMQGRYYIREGLYEIGRSAIDELIEIAKEHEDYAFMLKGIRQLVNYAVQTYDEVLMNIWIDKALNILSKFESKEEEGMIKRLRGLALMLMHRYDEAEIELKNAIALFKALDNRRGKYRLNIAACHNYLGDLHRMQCKFEEAMKSYELAIEISELSGVSRCTSIFLTNAGQTAFDYGRKDEARAYFEEAIRQFDVYGTVWKRAIAEGYMALIKLERNIPDEAYAHLEFSGMYAKKLKNPYSIGIFNKVRAKFKTEIEKTGVKSYPSIISLDVL
jgi:DNA-binding SARP family transcriptional activator/tetratricopeptide (TPR) repeat protein